MLRCHASLRNALCGSGGGYEAAYDEERGLPSLTEIKTLLNEVEGVVLLDVTEINSFSKDGDQT
jgi:hypothetical protein